jgi:hypothetical protein
MERTMRALIGLLWLLSLASPDGIEEERSARQAKLSECQAVLAAIRSPDGSEDNELPDELRRAIDRWTEGERS